MRVWLALRILVLTCVVALSCAAPVSAYAAASANDATVTVAGATLTDAAGNVWNFTAGGLVDENGAVAKGGSANVIEMAYVGGGIYQKNTSGQWWQWTGVAPYYWTGPVANPLPIVASPSGTVVTTAGQTITDASGNTWNFTSSGLVDENGALAKGASANVVEMAYVGGVIYQKNSNGQWWKWTGAAPGYWTGPVANPVPTPVAGVCGSASGGSYLNAPTANLCSAGSTSAVSGGSSWTWSCNGINGSTTNASCSATVATVSPSGTAVTTAGAIITDANGNTWNFTSGGLVDENGVLAKGASANVVEMAYVGGVIYQKNTAGQWWKWTGAAPGYWTGPVANPVPNPVLASCTDSSGTSHASGSTYTLTLSTTQGTTTATAAQCTYGGTQPTTTTVTQSYLCTNGTATTQGSSTSTTTNTGNPTCNAAKACGATPSGSTVTQTVSTTTGTTAATTAQCPYGGTQPTTTTVTQVQLCTNGTLTNQGNQVTTTTNTGSPTCNAAKACTDSSGASHASGSTYTLTLSTTQGTTTATAAQCPYGGTQPTTTTVTQSYLCTNGTATTQGSSTSTTVNTGSPTCNAAAACGATPSGSTVTQTVSTTTGSTTATTAQCPYGGTQPTTTTVTQVQLCTNGTLTNQGNQVTTTTNTGNPTCNAAPINGACGTASGGSYLNAPTSGLCATGTASSVTLSGSTWGWSCTGANNGTNASCSAAKLTVSASGTTVTTAGATLVDASGNVWNFTSGGLVDENGALASGGSAGVVEMAYVSGVIYQKNSAGNWYKWIGAPSYWSAVANPLPVNGAVGSAKGQNFTTLTSTSANLCAAGTVANFNASATNSDWTWSCAGTNGGTTDTSGIAYLTTNGACGTANGATLTAAPTTNLCATGTASSVTGSGPWTWTCGGINGGTTASCATVAATVLVNGQCGLAAVTASASAPTANLCVAGTASSVAKGSGSFAGLWTWSCAGSDGGATSKCSSFVTRTGTEPTDANGNIGATSYATLPFESAFTLNCWGCSNGLEPMQLFFDYNPSSVYNIFDPTHGATNAVTMLDSRQAVAGLEAEGLIPFSGVQRWEDTYEASFPSAPAGSYSASEPSYIAADREANAPNNFPNLPEFEYWADWIQSRPQLWDVASDGGTVSPYFRTWGGQWGFITPMTPLDAADCPPGMSSCTWGDLWAYKWSLTSALNGGYGIQLSDYSDSLPNNTGGATNQHGFNPRVIADFAAQYGYAIPGTTVAQQAAWIVANALNEWNDFYSQGYGQWYATMASRLGTATGRQGLVIDQCGGGPFIMRGRATDLRVLATEINPKNYLCGSDDQSIQGGRSGPIQTPPAVATATIAMLAAYEPLMRNGLNMESDDSAYWSAIGSFYPTLSSSAQTEIGYKLMKRLWLWTSWAHIADRSGDVRRALSFAERDYWDEGTLTALNPLTSLIQGIVPTQPFGPALYYSATAMRADEAWFGAVQSTDNLCGGNFMQCAQNETYMAQQFIDGGGGYGYYVSDAALGQIKAGSTNAPSAWIIPQYFFLSSYGSPPDAVTSMSASELSSLQAIAPIVRTPAALAALPNQPLLFTTSSSTAISAACQNLNYDGHNNGLGNWAAPFANPALTGFGFYDQNGRLTLVVTNPSTCPDAGSISGAIKLSQVKVGGALANGTYDLTDLMAGTSTPITITGGSVTLPVTLARWDTMVYAITAAP